MQGDFSVNMQSLPNLPQTNQMSSKISRYCYITKKCFHTTKIHKRHKRTSPCPSSLPNPRPNLPFLSPQIECHLLPFPRPRRPFPATAIAVERTSQTPTFSSQSGKEIRLDAVICFGPFDIRGMM